MKAEVYPSPDGWRFRVKGNNGEIMATGEAYVRRIDAESALKQLFSGGKVDVTMRDHGGTVVDHYTLPVRYAVVTPEEYVGDNIYAQTPEQAEALKQFIEGEEES